MGDAKKTNSIEDALIDDGSMSIDAAFAKAASGVKAHTFRKRKIWKRLRHYLGVPFRLFRAVCVWVAWRLWGRARYELAIRKGIARWKQLAGIDRPEPSWVADQRERLRVIAESKPEPEVAQAIHDEVIRTKIVPVELPRPESVD